MEYLTFACVGDVTVTDCTEADAVWASAEPAWDLMTDANFWPSCTRFSFVAAGVFPLKNVSQFFLIVAMVAAEPVPDELPAGVLDATGLAAADVAADVAAAVGVVELELLLLLEQAVIAAASARPATGAMKIRRAAGWNRNCMRLLGLGRMCAGMRSFFSLTEISSLPAVSYPAVCRDRRRARQFTAREVRLRQPMVHVKRGAILAHPGPGRAA